MKNKCLKCGERIPECRCITMNIEEVKDVYEGLKRNEHIVESIDKEFFFRFAETVLNELEKKDKVIDEMAAILTRYMSTIDNKPYDLSLGVSTRKMTLEEVKEYFYKKVSDNK